MIYMILLQYSTLLPEEAIDCTGDSWRHQAADGEWKTELSFPATWESSDAAPIVSFEGFFYAIGDVEVMISGIPTSIAPAVADSLYGRNIELLWLATKRIPSSWRSILACYSKWALRTTAQRSMLTWRSSGSKAEYLREDGAWYSWFTGSDGQRYNLTHVFFTTDFDQLHIATIQSARSLNLEAASHNRYVRLLILCSNQVNHEDGYLIFQVGGQDFDESCDDHLGLCVDDDPDGDTDSGVRCETGIGIAYVLTFVVGMLSLLLVLD
ncbi:unnamed protein product [Ectocarpus sp. CCAP 1310/34]|nr:unnamed protein product [Ectocarpus sp. CCAP 1310/34]